MALLERPQVLIEGGAVLQSQQVRLVHLEDGEGKAKEHLAALVEEDVPDVQVDGGGDVVNENGEEPGKEADLNVVRLHVGAQGGQLLGDQLAQDVLVDVGA